MEKENEKSGIFTEEIEINGTAICGTPSAVLETSSGCPDLAGLGKLEILLQL